MDSILLLGGGGREKLMNPSLKSLLTRKVSVSAEKPSYRSDFVTAVLWETLGGCCGVFLLGGGSPRKTGNLALFYEN